MPIPRSTPHASSISFRWALLLSVVAILLAAVGVLGVVSYANARSIVDDLAYQALDQTAARVHDRLGELLDAASHAGEVQAERLARKRWAPEDVPALVQGFHDAIQMNPALSYISVGLESGAYGHIYRNSDGTLDGRGYVHQGDGKSLRYDYRVVGGRLEEIPEARKDDTYDPRKRGWYERAKAKGTQTWPSVYLFINKPNPDYPGLTCATPVFDPDGELQGVSTADFDLIALGQFLSELAVLEGGVAFVVEESDEGTRRVIAHPVAETFLGRFEVDGVPRDDILPVDQIPDASVRTFMGELPVSVASARLEVLELDAEGTEYLGAYSSLQTDHDLNWTVAILVPRGALMAPVEESNRRSLWIGLISLLCAGCVAWLLSRRIAKPLEMLAKETEAIGRFELHPTAGGGSRFSELNRLSGAMEEMKSGLRSFGRYVPADLVRGVLASGEDVVLGGDRRTLPVCFTDIADFTALSETMAPEALVEWLGAYFETVSAAFEQTGGTVDKYIGDAVMAFWGAPKPLDNRALRACRGAIFARDSLADLRARFEAEGRPPIRVRFGIGTGELLVGNIGSSHRFNYTVIGDPVNLASRLEALNKRYGTEIIIDEETHARAGEAVLSRPIDVVSVKGRVEGTLIYEVIAESASATEEQVAHVATSVRALDLYRARAFEEALQAYQAMLLANPLDGVAFVMIQRCQTYIETPPGDAWDGIERLTEK